MLCVFLCIQNKRGGRVRLQSIVTPLTEFDHPEKGDALYGELLSASICLHHVFQCACDSCAWLGIWKWSSLLMWNGVTYLLACLAGSVRISVVVFGPVRLAGLKISPANRRCRRTKSRSRSPHLLWSALSPWDYRTCSICYRPCFRSLPVTAGWAGFQPSEPNRLFRGW